MAKKKSTSAAGKKAVKKRAATKTAAKKRAAPAKAAAAKDAPASLGRPKVTSDEQLDMLFHQHYHARQVFEFLRVHTVRELEQFSPQEIFRKLTQPVRETVDDIRRLLAEKNRHLADDLEFALEHKAQRGGSDG